MKNDAKNMNGKRRSAARFIYGRAAALVRPVSSDDDSRRRELILNTILVFSIIFIAVLDAMVGYNTIRIPWYYGISFTIFTLILIGYMSMFIASKRGYAKVVSYILIATYTAGSIYGGWIWGASLPATLLMFALISAFSGILVSSRFGLIFSAVLVVILGILGIHEIHILGVQSWKYETINTTDIILYGAIIFFVAGISWLSNRELEKSVRRMRESERALRAERDLLEIKVAQRTSELKRSQAERVEELSRIADFGRLARGLFHDLMTPLSLMAVHVEKLAHNGNGEDNHTVAETQVYVKKAINASERMGLFMDNIRRHIRFGNGVEDEGNGTKETCDIILEAKSVIDILGYKARQSGVEMRLISENIPENILLYPANSMYFHQIFQNLISNAIDAHSGSDSKNSAETEKYIDIEINPKKIIISDNGPGIAEKYIGKIFDPFFTTKSRYEGMGIGLSTVKNIVEEKLNGTIIVTSMTTGQKTGSVFIIELP